MTISKDISNTSENNSNSSSTSHWPLTAMSCFAALGNVIIPLILVRTFTPEDVGIYKIFFLYIMLAPLVSLTSGFTNGFAFWTGQQAIGRHAIKASSSILLIVATCATAVGLLLAEQITLLLQWPTEIVLLFILCLAPSILHNFYEELAIAHERIVEGAVFYTSFEFARAIALAGVALASHSLVAVLIAHTALSYCKLIMASIFAIRHGYIGLPSKLNVVVPVLRYAVPVSSAWLFGVFINHADQFILSLLISTDEFAFYAIGCLVIPPLLILENSVTRVLIPRLSKAFHRGEISTACKLYGESVRHLGFLIIPAVAGLFVFAEPIIELLFTAQYTSAASYLQIFAFSYLALIIPFDATARAQGNSVWILLYFVSFSLGTVLLTYVGVYHFGPMGALAALLVSKALMRFYVVSHMHQTLGWDVREILALPYLLRYAVLSSVLGFCSIIMEPMFESQILWFLVMGPLFGLIYLLVAMALKESTRESEPRVLMITQSVEIGGLEKMIFHLTSGLKNSYGVYASVFCYDHRASEHASLTARFEKQGINVVAQKKRAGFSFRTIFSLLQEIQRQQITVLHPHDLGSLIYAVFAKLLCMKQLRLVITQHSFVHLGRHGRYATYERLFTFFVDEICVVSEQVQAEYQLNQITSKPIRLIPNGVDFPSAPTLLTDRRAKRTKLFDTMAKEHAAQLSTLANKVWLLYMARVFPGKGHAQALAIWNELPDEVRDACSLLFVGPSASDSDHEDLLTIISNSKSRDHIAYIPGTTDPELWYQSADVFLSCSESEGMPLGPLEAAGNGLPCVLSQIPGHQAFQHIAHFIPYGDSTQGAATIAHLLEEMQHNPDQYFQTYWDNTQRLRDQYSTERMVSAYKEVYTHRSQISSGTSAGIASQCKQVSSWPTLFRSFERVWTVF